jgi:5-methyltetrahydrofolate--homocysteine methyltransferase
MESLAFELNVAAATLAKEAVKEFLAEHPATDRAERFVAGAIGPLKQNLIAFSRCQQSRLPGLNVR